MPDLARLGLAAGLAGVTGLALMFAGQRAPKPAPGDPGGIAVVAGPTPVAIAPRAPITAPSRAAPDEAAAAIAARLRRAFPVLSAAGLSCAGPRCALEATIRPPTGPADLDQRQAMLMGGLARLLGDAGCRLPAPFTMDEVDDNLFRLHASLLCDSRL